MFKLTAEQIEYFKKYNAKENFNKAFLKFTDIFFGNEDNPELTIMVTNVEKLFSELEEAANELIIIAPERKNFIKTCYKGLLPYVEEAERKGIHLSIPDHLVWLTKRDTKKIPIQFKDRDLIIFCN